MAIRTLGIMGYMAGDNESLFGTRSFMRHKGNAWVSGNFLHCLHLAVLSHCNHWDVWRECGPDDDEVLQEGPQQGLNSTLVPDSRRQQLRVIFKFVPFLSNYFKSGTAGLGCMASHWRRRRSVYSILYHISFLYFIVLSILDAATMNSSTFPYRH